MIRAMKQIQVALLFGLLFALSAGAKEAQKQNSIAVLTQDNVVGWADLVLSELNSELGKNGFEPVERGHLKKILAEHKLSASGMVRDPLRTGKMIGASYFVYVHAENNAGNHKLQILLVETASGNVLDEGVHLLPALDDDAKLTGAIETIAKRAKGAVDKAEKLKDLPTAAVLSVINKSKSRRLSFLEAMLTGTFGDVLEEEGFRLLRRQHADKLAGETALNVSGMVRPDAKVIAQASDLAVKATFVEKPSAKLSFRETPIHIRMTMTVGGKDHLFSHVFTLNTISKLPTAFRKAIPRPGNSEWPKKRPQKTGRKEARIEAARLLADLKPLLYIAELEDHRKTVEIARRVIFLDPSAKDAYFILGRSLDPLIRRTRSWRENPEKMKLLDQAIDAYRTYLQFPRTDKKRVEEVFRWLNRTYYSVTMEGKPEERMKAYAEEVRWRRSCDPNLPYVIGPRSERWWREDPRRRLKWYDWLDDVYDPKKGRSVASWARWKAHDQLNEYQTAAEWFYDAVVVQQRHSLREMLDSKVKPTVEKMAGYLDQKKAAELRRTTSRFYPKQSAEKAMHGDFRAPARKIDVLAVDWDRGRLGARKTLTVEATKVDLDQHDYSTFIRRTPAGLWVFTTLYKKESIVHFLPVSGRWKRFKLPEEAAHIDIMMLDACQLGDEVFFGIKGEGQRAEKRKEHGLLVHNLKTGKWRHLKHADGVGGRWVSRVAVGPKPDELYLYGDGYRTKYQDGKLFLTKRKVPGKIDAVRFFGEMEVLHPQFRPVSLMNFRTGKAKRIDWTGAQKTVPDRSIPIVPRTFDPSGPSNSRRTLAVVGDKLYCFFLARVSSAGKVEKHWRATRAYRWMDLVAVVEGNCPMPALHPIEMFPDDQNTDLLWLVHRSGWVTEYTDTLLHARPTNSNGRSYITCFNTKTGRFSQPIRTKHAFVCAEAFGDHLYLTGHQLTRVPKAKWKTTVPEGYSGDKPKVIAADTIVGRASKAFFEGDRKKAAGFLQEAIGKGIAVDECREMLKAIKRLR